MMGVTPKSITDVGRLRPLFYVPYEQVLIFLEAPYDSFLYPKH